MTDRIRFVDGAAYERYMGVWSRLVGEIFLDWVAPARGWRWLDVGCGNGAFTEMVMSRHPPMSVHGIDPSEAQLTFARTRPGCSRAQLVRADAMALPFGNNAFDAAVMPLVIFFVPEPATGVAEMARVVAPGGIVSAYAWDVTGGGFPYELLQVEMRQLGATVPTAPSGSASRLEVMHDLWTGAGLEAVEAREIVVQRSFEGFDDYWTTIRGGPSVGPGLAAMSPDTLALLKTRLQARLLPDGAGHITCAARARAIKGRVPGAPRG